MGSPGKNTELDCHFLLQGIFWTQGLNQDLLQLLPWQADSFTTEPKYAQPCVKRPHPLINLLRDQFPNTKI